LEILLDLLNFIEIMIIMLNYIYQLKISNCNLKKQKKNQINNYKKSKSN